MIDFKPRSVQGHDPGCIINYGHNDTICDCGALNAARERSLAEAKRARLRACAHELVGFRTAKVCKHCGQTKAEIKGGV